jgi:pectinesterase
MKTVRTVLGLGIALVALLASDLPVAAQGMPGEDKLVVRVENPLSLMRADEVVALSWSALRTRLPALGEGKVRVRDAAAGREVMTQLLDHDADGTLDELLFLASLWPNETRAYVVEAAPPALTHAPRAYAAYIPERDDVAWESDRIAYRTYGQGLWQASEYDPLVSSGIDVWPKRVHDLVIDRWYAKGHDAYHLDTGEGADFYSVGPTLGAGGTAVWHDGQLYRAENFKEHRIIADGPIRAIFALIYEPWHAGDREVSEVKRITIDAGQHFFRAESTFESETADELTGVVGFVKRPEGVVGSMSRARPWAWLSTWGPVEHKNGGHGDLGSAVLIDGARLDAVRETADHYLAFTQARPGEAVVHYVGAGWTASGDFDDVESWWAYLDTVAARLQTPLEVTLVEGESTGGE